MRLLNIFILIITSMSYSYIIDDFDNRFGTDNSTNYTYGSWYIYDDESQIWSQRDFNQDDFTFDKPEGFLPNGLSHFIYPTISGKDTVKNDSGNIISITNIYNIPNPENDSIRKSFFKATAKLSKIRPYYDHPTKKNDDPTYGGFVGIGTTLNPNDLPENLTDSSVISFDMAINVESKSNMTSDTFWVEFVVKTDQDVIKEHYRFYKVRIPVLLDSLGNSGWTRYEYFLENGDSLSNTIEFNQYYDTDSLNVSREYWGWEAADSLEFIKKITEAPAWDKTTALEWELSTDIGSNISFTDSSTSITLNIDSVVISNFRPSAFEINGSECFVKSTSNSTKDSSNISLCIDSLQPSPYSYGDSVTTNLVISEDLVDENSNSYFIEFPKTVSDSIDALYAGMMFSVKDYSDSTIHTNNGVEVTYSTTLEYVELYLFDSAAIADSGDGVSCKIIGTRGDEKTAEINFSQFKKPYWSEDSSKFNFSKIVSVSLENTGNINDTGTISLSCFRFLKNAKINDSKFSLLTEKPKERTFSLAVNEKSITIILPNKVIKASVAIISLNGEEEFTEDISPKNGKMIIDLSKLIDGIHVIKINSKDNDDLHIIKAISLIK